MTILNAKSPHSPCYYSGIVKNYVLCLFISPSSSAAAFSCLHAPFSFNYNKPSAAAAAVAETNRYPPTQGRAKPPPNIKISIVLPGNNRNETAATKQKRLKDVRRRLFVDCGWWFGSGQVGFIAI